MLTTIFLNLQTKINNTKQTIQDKHPSKLGILIATKIFLLEILFSFTKYLLIIFKHPTDSFKILVNQPALAVCPYSYTDHKTFQKRLRVFSAAGFTVLIVATIISSLILNLATGPIFQSKAATYTWNQTNWVGGATANNASHASNQTGWTEYSAKDINLTTVNAGADLQLVSAPTVNEYTIGALANINVDATVVTDNSNGTWTITLGTADLSRIFKNDKFKDEASPQKSWKILSSFDSANKIIVWDSEGNGGAPSAAGASQATVGRWYASISLWEAGRQGDLVTRGAIERGLPYYDGAADTTAVTIDGWTTDATHYVEIYVPLSERHRGNNSSGYKLAPTSDWQTLISFVEDYGRIEGLVFQLTQNNNTGINYTGFGELNIVSNIIYSTAPAPTRDGIALTNIGINGKAKIWNNIIDNVNVGIYSEWGPVSTIVVYNNTILNSVNKGISFDGNSYTAHIKNNLIQGTNTNYSILRGTGNTTSNNISQDATSPNIALRSKTVPFVDATNKDFHLEFRDGTGNPAMNAGADLSADANLAFNTDIDNDTRSGTWDIGADDAGATLVKAHSIGTASRNFATLQGWESARDGVLTTRNVFKIATQSAAFSEGETITGTSGATGTYIKERDTPLASETYMTVDKVNATAFVAGDTLTGGISLSTAALSTILTTAGTIERGEAYKDSTFTAGVSIGNSTTNSTHYMWLTAEPGSRHTGVVGTGVKIEANSAGSLVTANGASYTIIEWLDIKNNHTLSPDGFKNSGEGGDASYSVVRNNIFQAATSGVTSGNGIFLPSTTSNSQVYNNIIIGYYHGIEASRTTLNIYNNTIYNAVNSGILRFAESPNIRNNIVIGSGSTIDFNINAGTWGTSSSNNLSSDATAPGTNSLTSQTLAQVAFVSTTAGIEDFHLLPASVAKDAGTSLSPTFTTDIDSQTRPVGSAWDIGADEFYPVYQYPTSQTLTSSGYNSTDAANVIGSLSWTEDVSLPTGTGVTVSLRAATSSANLTSSSWSDFTNATTNCSKTTGVVTCSLAAIPAGLKDGSGDQWFQYKVTLTSTGVNMPTFSDLTLQYVVNAPPQFDTSFNTTGTTATQNSDGTVTIQYQVRDQDTTTGTVTPNAITPSFEYSTNGGTGYSSITSTYLASTDLQNKTVGESSYILYTATWNPKNQLGSSTYVTNAKIRVTLNDNEAANNTANAATANFTLDTTNPVPGTPSLSIVPNSATPTTAALTISATDNSSMQMKVGLASDLSDAAWETYNTSKTITLATDPDTVYAEFKDAYGNTTSIVSGATPETPTGMMVQDTSNLNFSPSEYRLFVAWKVIALPTPGFAKYLLYRSTSPTSGFARIDNDTLTSRTVNYYGDSSVTFDTDYYYKVASLDSNNNLSFFSETIHAKANGAQDAGEGGGGSDSTGPVISNVTSSNPQTTSVTITWTTNELSNSTVGFSTDTSFTAEQGVSSYVTSHSVTLTNLTPNTNYKFQVKSADPTGNQATNNNSGSGYTFTTQAGPRITNVDAEDISNTTAKIVWNTDKDSNSYIVYSTNSNLSSSTETGTTTLAGGSGPNYYHSVTLTSLTQGTNYYYYVKSTDSEGNIALNNNGLNYYTFKTTSDTTSPTISNITVSTTTPDTAIITWTTNEPSTSQIEYGTTTSYGTSTTQDTDLALTHIVSITNLIPNTAYNFRIKSSDASANQTTSANQTFTTKQESEIKTDRTAPTISNIGVTSITSNSATITFTSNESCTGTIDYGTTTTYTNTMGGNGSQNITTHTITLAGLNSSTAYNFKVNCRDSSDNVGSSDNQTFTTIAASTTGDTTAPVITNIQTTNITSNQATVTFATNESCLGVVNYGTSTSYNKAVSEVSNATSHSIDLGNLSASTPYHFQVKCSDSSNNTGSSTDQTFTTLAPTATTEGGKSEAEKRVENLLNEKFSNEDIQNAIKKLSSPPAITGEGPQVSDIRSTSAKVTWSTDKKANGIIVYGSSQSAIDNYKSTTAILESGINTEGNDQEQSLTHEVKLTNLIPGTTYYFKAKSQDIYGNITTSDTKSFTTLIIPLISNVEISDTTLSSAIITWHTSVITTGYLEYGKDTTYGSKKEHEDTTTKGTTHTIPLTSLDPTTTYHFRIKGTSTTDNSLISSEDYTFNTQSLPEITKEEIKKITDNSAKVTFQTNIPTDTQVFYKPLKQEPTTQSLSKGKPDLTKDHEIELTDLEFGTDYDIQIKVKDASNNQAQKQLPTFTTGIDITPPTITLLRTENALIPGKKDKVQTIITWKTDEPSTTQITYQEGIDLKRTELKEKTQEDKSLNKDHVIVLTNLKPGTVYQLKAISKDNQQNQTTSNNQTMLTPKQQESVFQVIMKNLEDVFGWVKKIR